MQLSDLAIVLTTVTRKSDAQALAEGIIRERLAACVQIDGPMQSIYHWNGGVVNDQEYRLSIKVSIDRLQSLKEWVHEQHPYETPQWIVLSAGASEAYGAWVNANGN